MHCRCGPRVSSRFFASDAKPRPASKGSDPTGTLPLQRRFQRDLRTRWDLLRKTVPNFVARTDLVSTINHAAITGQDPVRAFQKWFDAAIKMVVVGNGAWMNKYVREAGDAAIMRAGTLTQPVATDGTLKFKDEDVTVIDALLFGKGRGMMQVDAAPITHDRIPPLQTLSHVELQGIAEATSQQAVRAFTDGLLKRETPGQIARDVQQIIDKVAKSRSDLLVSFIVVRAFGTATLDAYRAAGITHVGTIPERVTIAPSITRDAKPSVKSKTKDLVEVLTAGDDKVCPQCEDISEEGPYTLKEAEALIPAHPRCRCAFVPASDARFASVHDDKDPLGHGSFSHVLQHAGHHALHHVAHHVGHHIGHHTRELFSGSHEQAHEKLQAEGYAHESTTQERTPADKPVHVSRFSHPDGHAAEVRTRQKVDENGDPVSQTIVHRHKMEPMPTRDSATHTAAGVMFLDPEGRALFVRRSDTGDHAEEWAFPGGAIEPGETSHMAAWREAYEEVGMPAGGLEEIDRREMNGTDFTTFVEHVPEQFEPELNHEHTDHVWARLDAPPSPLHPGVAATIASAVFAEDFDPEFAEADHPRDTRGRWTAANHPAGPHKRDVRGVSAERVSLRRALETKTDPERIRAAKLKSIASFWKQHVALVRAGKLDKAAEIAEKMKRYAAKYNIPNPLENGVAPAHVPAPSIAPGTMTLEQKKAKLNADLPKLAMITSNRYRPGTGQTYAATQKLVDHLASRDITAEQFVKGMLPIPTSAPPRLTLDENTSFRTQETTTTVTVSAGFPGGGSITRVINLSTGKVDHAFFRAGSSDSTGHGMGKDVLRSQIALYQRLGMKKVEVGANIDVGGYAWARYGFVPHQADWNSLRRQIDRSLNSSHLLGATDTEVSGLRKLIASTDPKTMWAVADSKFGKKLLLGTSWHGDLVLTDAATMRRFNAYVSREQRA